MPDDQDDSPPPPKTTNAFASPLRLVPVAALVPAFALCLAHGVVSHRPAPAAGIAPLFVSAVSSLVLLRLRPAPAAEGDEAGAGADGEEEQTAAQRAREVLMHPIVIFALDALLAAALMLVLVYTWMSPGRRGSLAMLAAYATIPLLAAFFVHLYLASQAISDGFALHRLSQWVAWRAVPPDCPNCNARLRPALPEFPWFGYLRRRRAGYAPVFADDQDRYRDDDAAAAGQDSAAPAQQQQPEAVEVRKKSAKTKGTTAVSEETTTGSPWGS